MKRRAAAGMIALAALGVGLAGCRRPVGVQAQTTWKPDQALVGGLVSETSLPAFRLRPPRGGRAALADGKDDPRPLLRPRRRPPHLPAQYPGPRAVLPAVPPPRRSLPADLQEAVASGLGARPHGVGSSRLEAEEAAK